MGGIEHLSRADGITSCLPLIGWARQEASCQGNLWPSRVKDKWDNLRACSPLAGSARLQMLSPSLLLDPAFRQFPCLHHPTSGSLQGLLCLAFWSTLLGPRLCWSLPLCWSPDPG